MCGGRGEVAPPPRNPAAFLLTARRGIVAERDRRKSANDATLRATRQVAALSVLIAAYAAPIVTPTVTTAPPSKTLDLSRLTPRSGLRGVAFAGGTRLEPF